MEELLPKRLRAKVRMLVSLDQGLGLLGFRVQGLGFLGLGFWGLGFRVFGFKGFGV